MPTLIGKTLGRYHILEQLGEGGMATVYKAFDTSLERNVAVKVIRAQKGQEEKFLTRFSREAKALARLSHPNIVKVLDYGEYRGLPYIVMEYLPGGTLKQRLGKPLPWQEAARMLIPIARALDYAHQNHIVHRDVKPSNVLITDSGEMMLSDFGIAKMLESDETTVDLTGTGVGIGTPEYMAPEQGMGHGVDHRADIYALGIVLYEMVTGRKPYQADTPVAILLKKNTEPLPRPGQYVTSLPESVERVLIKALAKDPQNRYQSMTELVAALEQLARGEKVAFPGETGEETITVPTRKIPAWVPWVAGGGSIGLCIIVALVVALILMKNNGPASPDSNPTNAPSPYSTISPPNDTVEEPPTTTIQTPSYTPTVFIPTPLPTSSNKIVITFVADGVRESSDVNVYVADANGNGKICVACKNSCYEGEPALSPDGNHVVYQSNCSGDMDIWIVESDGGTQSALTSSSYYERDPSFSPDGEKIVYSQVSGEDSSLSGELRIMNRDGSGATSLGIYGRGPVYSPDGKFLAYMSNSGGNYWQIYIYDLSSHTERKLTNSDGDCRWPTWSPDGKYIAYNDTDDEGNGDSIWYIPVSGSSRAVLVVSGYASRPSWSSTGYIAFNTGLGEKCQIDIIMMDGSRRKTIIPAGLWAWAPSWSR